MPDDRCVVYDFGIATKQLIAPPVDENAGAQGKKQRNRESDAQRRYTGGLDSEKKSERVHVDLTRWRKARLRSDRGVSWLAFILCCLTPLSPEFPGRHFRKIEIFGRAVFRRPLTHAAAAHAAASWLAR